MAYVYVIEVLKEKTALKRFVPITVIKMVFVRMENVNVILNFQETIALFLYVKLHVDRVYVIMVLAYAILIIQVKTVTY